MFPWDWIDPFGKLGSEAAKVAADMWIATCLSVWWAGLWLLRLVLGWMDFWLTPDLTGNGPGHALYGTTFWIAGVLVVIMMMIQLGIAVLRGDGKSLGRAVLGVGQFMVIVAGWVGYAVAVTVAAGGLTRALMESLLNVTTWRQWTVFNDAASVGKSITDGGVAAILMLLGLFVWLAAIGHFVVVLARDAALMILVAVGPIAAAGLANDSTRSWFWKTFRWFHAAVFTPFLVVLVTGMGMKFTTGVPTTINGGPEASIGTAVPAVLLILVSIVSPLALFKMLAFVDPGTASGAAMRAGMAAMGGMQGLLSGNPTAGATADGGAPSGDQADTSGGEASAEATTNTKVANAAGSTAAIVGGVGAAAAAGIGVVMKLGALGASAVTDVTNQAGIGHNTYQPDYQAGPQDRPARQNREDNAEPDESQSPTSSDPDGPSPTPAPTGGSSSGGSSSPAGGKPPAGPVGGGGSGGGASGAGGSGAGASSAEVAEVAVVAL